MEECQEEVLTEELLHWHEILPHYPNVTFHKGQIMLEGILEAHVGSLRVILLIFTLLSDMTLSGNPFTV